MTVETVVQLNLPLAAFSQVNQAQHIARGRERLGQLDLLRAEAKSASNARDKRRLEQTIYSLRKELACIIQQGDRQKPAIGWDEYEEGRQIWVVLFIDGVVPKKYRREAVDWLASRGRDWEGSKQMHREIRKAVRKKRNTVPSHYFGLRVDYIAHSERFDRASATWKTDDEPTLQTHDDIFY